MKKLTKYQKNILSEYGKAWLYYYEKMVEHRKNINSKEYEKASNNCNECRTVIEALSIALQVDCSLVDHRFIVSTKKDGELFSWGI